MTEQENVSCGLPCISHSCVDCCLATQMPLTEKDTDRLRKLGYDPSKYSVEDDGEIHLRNVSGKCFFLVDNRCIVYQNRPEGCRLYPLVYDVDGSKFVIDDYCPHHLNFIALRENKDNLKTLLRRVDKEREKRLRVRR